jgi:hypothetical protein
MYNYIDSNITKQMLAYHAQNLGDESFTKVKHFIFRLPDEIVAQFHKPHDAQYPLGYDIEGLNAYYRATQLQKARAKKFKILKK